MKIFIHQYNKLTSILILEQHQDQTLIQEAELQHQNTTKDRKRNVPQIT